MANGTKGRKASPVTVAIRKLVKSKKGNITFSVAKPLLLEQAQTLGVDVNAEGFEGKFNMTKYLYIKKLAEQGVEWAVEYQKSDAPAQPRKVATRKQEPAAPLPPPKHKPQTAPTAPVVEVNFAAAVGYIEKAGGLTAAKAALDARRAELEKDAALVAAFEAHVDSLRKLAA